MICPFMFLARFSLLALLTIMALVVCGYAAFAAFGRTFLKAISELCDEVCRAGNRIRHGEPFV